MTDGLVDRREPGFYIVDNEIIEDFGTRLGVYGIAVYNVLLKFSNANGENAFPSYQTIADLLGISRPKAIEGVKLLQECGLVEKTARKSSSGDPTTNVYTLLDVKKTKGGGKQDLLPSKQDLLGGGKQDLLGGKPRLPDQYPMINTQSDQKPPKKKRGTPASPPLSTTNAIKDAYVKAVGHKLPPSSFRTISPDAKFAAEQGVLPSDIRETYDILASEPFWRGKTIPLRVVLDKIANNMTIRNGKGVENGQAGENTGYNQEEIAAIRTARRTGDKAEVERILRAANARIDAETNMRGVR